MSYTKTQWINNETPLNAENMNKIENQVSILQETKVPTVSNEISILELTPLQRLNSYVYGKVEATQVQIPLNQLLDPVVKTIESEDLEGVNKGDYIFHKEGL
jgi:hypothetical protein